MRRMRRRLIWLVGEEELAPRLADLRGEGATLLDGLKMTDGDPSPLVDEDDTMGPRVQPLGGAPLRLGGRGHSASARYG